jgi:alkylhydroperoxidase family enzyme
MMRINPLTQAAPGTKAAKALESRVGHMTIFRTLAHSEATVIPILKMGAAILGKEQVLDARSRELAVLLALRMEGGRYEWPQHVDIGLQVGVTEAEVKAIEALALSAEHFSERDLALLEFSRQVVENVQVEDSAFQQLNQYLSEAEMVELVVAIGFYMMLARVTEAFDIDAESAQGSAVLDSVEKSNR